MHLHDESVEPVRHLIRSRLETDRRSEMAYLCRKSPSRWCANGGVSPSFNRGQLNIKEVLRSWPRGLSKPAAIICE